MTKNKAAIIEEFRKNFEGCDMNNKPTDSFAVIKTITEAEQFLSHALDDYAEQVCLEVIGKDEKEPRKIEQPGYMKFEVRNSLRAEARQRLKDMKDYLLKEGI